MDAKVSVTTRCNGRCRTCPVWKYDGEDMSLPVFEWIWTRLMESPEVGRVLINNTGDMYVHPKRREIFRYIEGHLWKPVIMTTNAAEMDYVPRIHELIISFNGYSKDSYEYTTGLPFFEVVNKIRGKYQEMQNHVYNAEIHCLMWSDTYCEDAEAKLAALWHDFPGRVRVSYKYDNQQVEDLTIGPFRQEQRVPCDYLDKLNIWPNGDCIMCAHDFAGSTVWGNLVDQPVSQVMRSHARLVKKAKHAAGEFDGICAACNYNVNEQPGQVKYIKG